jgi:PAS domain S-box-containing protein
MAIRVLIADDDRALASALADTVKAAEGMEVVGVRHDADSAVNAAAIVRPDVVLVDVRMPGGGVAATRRILAQQAGVAVVGLSAHEDEATALSMLEAGAVGYLVKGMPEVEITEAIRRASRGQMSMPADLGMGTLRDLLSKLHDTTEAAKALRSSEERVRSLLDAMPDALLIVNTRGEIVVANAPTQRLFGYSPGELVGQSIDVLVPDRFKAAHSRLVGDFQKHPRGRPMGTGIPLYGRRKNGTEFPVDISLGRMHDGGEMAVVAAVRDITESRSADEVRRKREALVHGLLESAPDAMIAVDARGRIQVVNSRAEQLFGYSRDDLVGMSVDALVPDGRRAAHEAHRAAYLREPQVRGMAQDLDLSARRCDGSECPVDLSLSPMATDDGMLVIAAVRDITDRKLAERRLAETQEIAQRHRLVAHLVQAQEEERRKIAADIHDDSIQAMTAASLRLQQLRRHMVTEQQQELVGRLDEAVRESITRLRRLMFDLRPPSLDRAGIGAALRELLERMRAETDIDFTLEDHLPNEPSGDVGIELYRITQEAVANVRKHSNATLVQVILQPAHGGCLVRIADNGNGFDAASWTAQPGHLGLIAMRERSTIAGGWWKIESEAGRPTTIEFWLPDEHVNGEVSAGRPTPGSQAAPR